MFLCFKLHWDRGKGRYSFVLLLCRIGRKSKKWSSYCLASRWPRLFHPRWILLWYWYYISTTHSTPCLTRDYVTTILVLCITYLLCLYVQVVITPTRIPPDFDPYPARSWLVTCASSSSRFNRFYMPTFTLSRQFILPRKTEQKI